MYLLDTYVIAEYRKGHRANPGVVAFFAAMDSKTMFLPVQVLGEIQAGIGKLRRQDSVQSRAQADVYQHWLDSLVSQFGDRVLEFDIDAARIWGTLLSNEKNDPHTIDKQIAAIALMHNLTVVTRDGGEAFSAMPGVKAINPFVESPAASGPRRRH